MDILSHDLDMAIWTPLDMSIDTCPHTHRVDILWTCSRHPQDSLWKAAFRAADADFGCNLAIAVLVH
eukprot:354399-Chlamydomonas_euryale.AAC.9